MSYAVLTTSPAHKMFKKFPTAVRSHLKREAQRLAEQPYLGQQLSGEMHTFRSLHTKLNNVQYRMVYEVNEAQKQIVLRAVGTRQNFYKRLAEMKLQADE